MAGSADDLPLDGLPLDALERAKHEFKLDEQRERLIKALKKGLPLAEIGRVITEDYWLAHVLMDIESKNVFARGKALAMLGQYLGILSDKKRPGQKRRIKFVEDGE